VAHICQELTLSPICSIGLSARFDQLSFNLFLNGYVASNAYNAGHSAILFTEGHFGGQDPRIVPVEIKHPLRLADHRQSSANDLLFIIEKGSSEFVWKEGKVVIIDQLGVGLASEKLPLCRIRPQENGFACP
jgi:hypothetical protein